MSRTTRRRFLRGACGTALALPMLDWLATSPAAADPIPPRLLVYYLPNGRRPEWWVPSASGGTLSFPTQSAALQPFADRAIAVADLDNIAARNSPGAAHAMGTGTVMTGRHIPDLGGLHNGISLDQLVANELSPPTRFKSLQWSAGEPGPCDVGGASCAFTQSISWAGTALPLVPTIDPASAFDRLFKAGADGLTGAPAEVRKRSIASVLDFVRDDARSLETRLGSDDRARLDEYFTGLRELETSLIRDVPSCEVPVDGPSSSLPYPDRVQAFHQLIKLAFQCDQTRIVSFMIEFGLSGRSHDFIGAPGAHHGLSHFGNDDEKRRLEIVERWHADQIAHLLTLLAETSSTEGRSLLDDTIVLVMPSMGAGSNHDHGRTCPILFGGTGVLQQGGRRVDAPGVTLANLHVTLMRAYGITGEHGVPGAAFGDDGTTEVAGILA